MLVFQKELFALVQTMATWKGLVSTQLLQQTLILYRWECKENHSSRTQAV